MTWYVDRRRGMYTLPWRILPAIPLFVLSMLIFLTVVAPVFVLILLARWLFVIQERLTSRFARHA